MVSGSCVLHMIQKYDCLVLMIIFLFSMDADAKNIAAILYIPICDTQHS